MPGDRELVRIVTEGAEGEPAVNDWKRFLAAGGSVPPAEMAKLAGVDITTDGPLNATIDYIGSVIEEIIKLTEEIDGIVCD